MKATLKSVMSATLQNGIQQNGDRDATMGRNGIYDY